MKKTFVIFASLLAGVTAHAGTIDLSGKWEFGFSEKLGDTITLPATTETARKGKYNRKSETKHLTRNWKFEGKAWYSREIDIPEDWAGKRIVFSMERTKTATVWLDGKDLGTQDSLCTAQVFELGDLTPGKHRLTICIDNKTRPPVGDPHQLSDQTQTNWNGILGKIEIRATPKVYIDAVRVDGKRVLVQLGGTDDKSWHDAGINLSDVGPWDEFSPNLKRVTVKYAGDEREVVVGVRDFKTKGTQFTNNGKVVFLRGKHDACVFPLTGHPPMDVEGWMRVMSIAKSYGINHYRFHTWCPPEAAFEAADRLGIYMQPELPVWGPIGAKAKRTKGDVEQKTDSDPVQARTDYLREEGLRILRKYGHHPSFVMFSLGNEMNGSREVMKSLVDTFRSYAPDKLYVQGSNNFFNDPQLAEGDEYWTTTFTRGHYRAGNYYPDTKGSEVRGSYAVDSMGHINNEDCGTMRDYSGGIKDVPVPVIGHEIGQFTVYPDYAEIDKYTGVTRADNLRRFKTKLEQNGLGGMDRRFSLDSGKLAVQCYREDIEAALRTPGFGGFQILDLQDFSGQGTALVGILDSFMDSKGLVTPEEWRRFCSAVVPLARMEKRIWEAGEIFKATIQVANYGPCDLDGRDARVFLTGFTGFTGLANKATRIPQGAVTTLGEVVVPLDFVKTNSVLKLTVKIGEYENDYPVWVYANKSNNQTIKQSNNLSRIVRKLDGETLSRIEAGAKVLYIASGEDIVSSIPGAFITDFWCYPMFKRYNPAGTMGLSIDSASAAFASFPTQSHSDWQWWRVARHSPAMDIAALPANAKVLVRTIDNLERNLPLALMFEVKIGKGRLIATSIDLEKGEPEIVALKESILKYLSCGDAPAGCEIDALTLSRVFRLD